MAEILTVTSENFEKDILNCGKPALIDLWADWCGPCRMMAPVFDDVAEELRNEMVFGKVNVDEEAEIAAAYGVMSIPTMILFKNGEEAGRVIGVKTRDELINFINSK